jgi:hypothetical protein
VFEPLPLPAIPYCFQEKRKAQKEGTQQILFHLEKTSRFAGQMLGSLPLRAYALGRSQNGGAALCG